MLYLKRLLLVLLIPFLTAANWPVKYYKCNDFAGTATVINVGSVAGNGTAARNTNTAFGHATGKVGYAFDFNGTTDYVNGNSDFIGTGADSACAWVQPDGFGENNFGRILDNGKTIFGIASDTQSLFLFSNGVSGRANSASNSVVPNGTTWFHACFTRSAAAVTNLYINGALSGSANQNGVSVVAGTTNVFIGADSASTATWDGRLDDTRIFDSELTAAQVKYIYDRTKSKYWTIGARPAVYYKMEDNAGTKTVTNSAVDLGGTPGTSGTSFRNTVDFSTASGKVNRGFNFNGTSDYVDTASDMIGTGAASVTFWTYSGAQGAGTYNKILDNGNFTISHAQPNSNELFVGNKSGFYCASSGNIPTSVWTHWVVTRTGDATGLINIYRNGILDSTANCSTGGVNTAGTGHVFIGSTPGAAQYWTGALDNVRVYNSVLSYSEARAIYNIEAAGIKNFRSGKYFLKGGDPWVPLGIYYIDTGCAGGNAAEIKRAAAIADMGSMGLDFVELALGTNDDMTMGAVFTAGMDVIPEWNATYTDVDARYGPLEAFLVFDDFDSGAHTCGDIQTEASTKKTNLSGTPLAYASGGAILVDTATYFNCGLDTFGYQGYPVGDGNYGDLDYNIMDRYGHYWNNYPAPYTGPLLANAQSFKWAAFRAPTGPEIYRMALWAQGGTTSISGIIWYTYYDANTDLSDAGWATQRTYLGNVVTELKRCKYWWLRKLMTE